MDGQIVNLTRYDYNGAGQEPAVTTETALDSDLKKMKGSAAGKSGSGGQGVTAAASLTGWCNRPRDGGPQHAAVKTATQVVTDTVTPPLHRHLHRRRFLRQLGTAKWQ